MTAQAVAAQERRDEARWLLSYGTPISEVAERCHVSIPTVRGVAQSMGLPTSTLGAGQKENEALAKRMTEVLVAIYLRRGITDPQVIATTMNLSRRTVVAAIKRAGEPEHGWHDLPARKDDYLDGSGGGDSE